MDYREMLDREQPDFVDVITPPSSHREASRYNEANCPDPRYTFGEFLVEGNGGSLRLSLQKFGSI